MRLGIFIYFLSSFSFCWSNPAEVYFEEMKIHHGGSSHSVAGFLLDASEVSNVQYSGFVKRSGVRAPLSQRINTLNSPQQPVSGVDWYDASFFCKFYGKRLPTYIELVRASQGEILRKFPFGNTSPDFQKAPFRTLQYSPSASFPVSSFPEFKTPEGVFHLAGNVREWTQDPIQEESGTIQQDSKRRVYGGSYISGIKEVRVGSVQWVDMADSSMRDVGFRCARDLDSSYDFSSVTNLDPAKLRQLVYRQKASREELLQQSAGQSAERIREEQKKLDKQKLEALIRQRSLEELRRRELLVSESVELEEKELTGIPFGITWYGGGAGNSLAQSLLYLDRYDIQKSLVTNEQFQQFLSDSQHKPLLPPGLIPEESQSPAKASWHDARAYCQANLMDLPTEAQWEKAVRGIEVNPKLRHTLTGATRGYYEIYQVVSRESEWMRDAWTLPWKGEGGGSFQTLLRNPIGKQGFLRAVRGRGEFPEEFATITNRRASMTFALHAFRCVREPDSKPDFIINEEWNYFFPEFFSKLQERIKNVENVFGLEVEENSFENEP
ncbi:SUMF1/EgtB/PvdO family nonheme iron enzyme [bacterium]|jgi:formylglycine-generating enzyme required for sulfatase activity|nr:SUMF1/EgtB/PvdO family nonheme iron enzyme [bacterium]